MKNKIKKINMFTYVSAIIFVLMIVAPIISYTFASSSELDMSNIDNIIDSLPEIEEGSVIGVPTWDISDKNQAIDCYLFAYEKYLKATNLEIYGQGINNTPVGPATNKNWRYIDSDGDVEDLTLVYGIPQAITSVSQYYNRLAGGDSAFYYESHNKIVNENTPYQTGNYKKTTIQARLDDVYLIPEYSRYIVSKATVKKVTFFNKTKNGYSFKFVLDNDLSTINAKPFYKSAMSGLGASTPVFSKVEVEFMVGFDGNFIKAIYIDAYRLNTVIMEASINTVYAETFKFNADVKDVVLPN